MLSALVSNVALGLDFCAKTTELILRIYFPMKAAVVRHPLNRRLGFEGF